MSTSISAKKALIWGIPQLFFHQLKRSHSWTRTSFFFWTTFMVMAVELYQAESERQFCHYVTYAHRKLVQFVESRKQMTAESYRFFLEHAYRPTIRFSNMNPFTSLRVPRQRPRTLVLQELSIHLQSFLAICGLVVRPNLFMFQKIKLVMFKWIQMMSLMKEQMICQVCRSRFNKMIKMKFRKECKNNRKMKNTKMMKFMKRFPMNRWKVYALKKERKHKSSQDTLKR